MSWKPEVIADGSKWASNGLRFATQEEANAYVADLAWRWTSVRETRVVETDEPVTCELRVGKVHFIESRPLTDSEAREEGV